MTDFDPFDMAAEQRLHDMLIEYARLERRRSFDGLSPGELRLWVDLKQLITPILSLDWNPRELERRRAIRVPAEIRCSFACSGELREGLITNMSTAGIFVATDAPAPVGTRLELELIVGEGQVVLKVTGVVVTNVRDAEPQAAAGMGVNFVDLLPDVLKGVHDLYEKTIRIHFGPEEQPGPSSSQDGDGDLECQRNPSAGEIKAR